MSLVTRQAPDFSAQAVVKDQITKVHLGQFRGQYVILFFYPLDFTFVCPTEIIAFQEHLEEFTKRNAVVLGCSVDSVFSHLAWNNLSRKEGGLGGVTYPLVADLNKEISKKYGVLLEGAGIALRGLFLIDKAGVVRHSVVNDLPLGRSIPEALRVLEALQFVETHGEVCPANWKPGEATMKADPVGSKEYFSKAN
jgi:peroxiredoxin (alkyl hydroperoxide reductase subunit C)